jgi:hypothetical protein
VAFSDLLKFGKRSGSGVADAPAPKGSDPVIVSKALPKFVAALSQKPSPVLLDFGPVIGSNVAYFGEQLGCKLVIEDLAVELDRHTKADTREQLPEALVTHFPKDDQSVDGILCWDLIDFLERPAATAIAREIVRVLKPGGAVMGFFCTSAVERSAFTKFEILQEQSSMRHRHHPGVGGQKFVLQNRDIIKMFEGLFVSDSFLLKSNTREILLRRRS